VGRSEPVEDFDDRNILYSVSVPSQANLQEKPSR
jgi:hypothetical protein